MIYRILGRMIKNLHKLIFCLALVTFCFSSFTNFALAAEKQKTITCERSNAPSWFRPDLHPKIITNQKRTNWQIQHGRGPSHVKGKYIVFTSRNGSQVRYKCDGPAWEVAYGFMDDWRICLLKSKRGRGYDQARLGYSDEAKRRGLDCQSVGFNDRYASFSDQFLCSTTQKKTKPSGDFLEGVYNEVLKRGLTCGTNVSIKSLPKDASMEAISARSYDGAYLCKLATVQDLNGQKIWTKGINKVPYVNEAARRGLDCGVKVNDIGERLDANMAALPNDASMEAISARSYDGAYLCKLATVQDLNGQKIWTKGINKVPYVNEAARRGLDCGVKVHDIVKSGSSAAELELERQKRIQLEAELAALKAKQKQKQQRIFSDNQVPLITIVSALTNGPQGTVRGQVANNNSVAEVRIDGQPLRLDSTGGFTANTYVPEGGVSVTIEAFNLAGLSSSMSVRLDRTASNSTVTLDFDRLNPIARDAVANPDALALIIGLEQYEKTDAKAAYADADAKVFSDYASLKLGISQNRIKTLVNENADISDVLLSVKDWLSRAVKKEKSDVYIFFAGHGLASDDGEKMYLLPYDGSPRLLSRTALLRDELFADIAAANPRSVTVFLDTCYSGTTRGTDMLIAARPIAIRAKEQAVPEGFTVMTAAAGDQTAKPLEEAKHGMFSYFLMKGMEGDADANSDNQITAGELHAYVQQNVIQQSSGSQTPELQGDADRILIRFQ